MMMMKMRKEEKSEEKEGEEKGGEEEEELKNQTKSENFDFRTEQCYKSNLQEVPL